MRDAAGKYITEAIVETKASTLLDFIKGMSGTIHLTFEEGTQSAWLYDLFKPHVAELIVCDPRRNKLLAEGSKGDRIDVQKLSELFCKGMLKPVYHGDHGTRALKELTTSKPAPVIQVRKGGSTKQARKDYKLTDIGRQQVERMLRGGEG